MIASSQYSASAYLTWVYASRFDYKPHTWKNEDRGFFQRDLIMVTPQSRLHSVINDIRILQTRWSQVLVMRLQLFVLFNLHLWILGQSWK